MKKYYTYIQYFGNYRYIGKGSGDRYLDIKNHCKQSKLYKDVALTHVMNSVIIEYFDNEEDAYNAEIEIIKLQRKMGYKLLNITDGGNYPPKSKKGKGLGRKTNKPAWNRNKKMPVKGVETMRLKLIGNKNGSGNKNKSKSKIHIDNISKSLINKPKKQSKPVVCIELNKQFHTYAEAARFVRLKNSGDIHDAAKGKKKSAGGYHWEFA